MIPGDSSIGIEPPSGGYDSGTTLSLGGTVMHDLPKNDCVGGCARARFTIVSHVLMGFSERKPLMKSSN